MGYRNVLVYIFNMLWQFFFPGFSCNDLTRFPFDKATVKLDGEDHIGREITAKRLIGCLNLEFQLAITELRIEIVSE